MRREPEVWAVGATTPVAMVRLLAPEIVWAPEELLAEARPVGAGAPR